MPTTPYTGIGASVDEARDALYQNAGTTEVKGIKYTVTVAGKSGESHKTYEKALVNALRVAGIQDYDPDSHTLEVTARGEVKVAGRASGAAPSAPIPKELTDLL